MRNFTFAIVVIVAIGVVAFALTRNQQSPKEDKTVGKQVEPTEISNSPTPQAMEEKSSNVKTITIEGKSFSFTPKEIRVKQGDTVRITFKNTGGFHDWTLDEFKAQTKQISTGESDTVEFVADKKGSFEYYCSVGNHRLMGMKGTLTVE